MAGAADPGHTRDRDQAAAGQLQIQVGRAKRRARKDRGEFQIPGRQDNFRCRGQVNFYCRYGELTLDPERLG